MFVSIEAGLEHDGEERQEHTVKTRRHARRVGQFNSLSRVFENLTVIDKWVGAESSHDNAPGPKAAAAKVPGHFHLHPARERVV